MRGVISGTCTENKEVPTYEFNKDSVGVRCRGGDCLDKKLPDFPVRDGDCLVSGGLDFVSEEFAVPSEISEIFGPSSESSYRSSCCKSSIALSMPSGNQYSAQAHNTFPSGETSKPPSL